MDKNIIKLTDRLLPDECNNDLVEALEQLTERARRGEIVALAWAGVVRGDAVITGWDGAGGTMFHTAAAIQLLQMRYSQMMAEGDD